MFFEVNITPKRKDPTTIHKDLEAHFHLSLAPFLPKTQIRIETFLNETACCYLSLSNPSDRPLNVQVTKTPPIERSVAINLSRLKIEPHKEEQLIITWTAKKPGIFRDIIQLTDSRCIKYDIALTTSTIIKKKHGNNGKKSKENKYSVREPSSKRKVLTENYLTPAQNSNSERILSLADVFNTPSKRYKSSISPGPYPGKENISNNHSAFDFQTQKKSSLSVPGHTKEKTDVSANKKLCDSSPLVKFGDTLGWIPDIWSSTPAEIQRLVPSRFPSDFARLSPIRHVVEQPARITENDMSPSSIRENNFNQPSANTVPTSRFDGLNFPVERSNVCCGLQEVLGADLWAKPIDQSLITALRNKPLNLKSIREETAEETRTESFDKMQTIKNVPCITPVGWLIEFSPPKNNRDKKETSSPLRRISLKNDSKISKDKTAHEKHQLKKKAAMNYANLKTGGEVSMPGVNVTKLSSAGTDIRKQEETGSIIGSFEQEVSMKLRVPEDFFTRICHPDPFAPTTIKDPFLTSALYDDNWVESQKLEFKKWLNTVLTPPDHLTSDIDTSLVNVARVWQSCRLKEEVSLPETKEAVSARYHTNERLNTLRRSASLMIRSDAVTHVLIKIIACVEKGNLVIREDQYLHKDTGLQKFVLELFLSYNPLWLRIGLGTIYGETIPLNSNNDVIRLSKFLLSRFFTDPEIVKTHSHKKVPNLRLPTFLSVMNKFILKKFLTLIYFLDYAKTHKLIDHDPCLFHKQSIHKESRQILLQFSQQLLSGVSNITKELKPYGYVLIHKQTELDEYIYAVDNLSHDLRDGVILCRIIELITGKRDLTALCRVPAISRLQKVHNVNVALKTLTDSGYVICGDITAKCIADGKMKKTLSLLWQIIYKFQAPYFNKAATKIQKWWRSKLLFVMVKNFLLIKRKNDAACIIQRAWRFHVARKLRRSNLFI